MSYGLIRLILMIGAVVLLAAACQKDNAAQSGSGKGATSGDTTWEEQSKRLSKDSEYPILWSSRAYQDIHDSARQAWWLVETSYFVVDQKYEEAAKLIHSKDPEERRKGADMRKATGEEMERSIFGVNDEVERLFLDAIAAQPDNPLNHAVYALYLKPRKRYQGETYVNTRSEALEQVEKAIALWPDDASFYMLKAYIISGSDRCHDWYRTISRPPEEAPQLLEELREAYTNAALYYPDNGYINYARAMDVLVYTPPQQHQSIREELMREIRSGNAKPVSIFYHGPPVAPFAIEPKEPRLYGTEKEPVWTDQWHNFGHIDYVTVDAIVNLCGAGLTYPEDKDDIQELMYFLYRLGGTRPYDRSCFGLLPKLLVPVQFAEDSTEERIKLQAVLTFMNTQYRDAAVELAKKKFEIKSTEFDAVGISAIETSHTGRDNIKTILQPRFGATLKKAEEELGMKFKLPTNKEAW